MRCQMDNHTKKAGRALGEAVRRVCAVRTWVPASAGTQVRTAVLHLPTPHNQGTSGFFPLCLTFTSATALSIAAMRCVVDGWLAV